MHHESTWSIAWCWTWQFHSTSLFPPTSFARLYISCSTTCSPSGCLIPRSVFHPLFGFNCSQPCHNTACGVCSHLVSMYFRLNLLLSCHVFTFCFLAQHCVCCSGAACGIFVTYWLWYATDYRLVHSPHWHGSEGGRRREWDYKIGMCPCSMSFGLLVPCWCIVLLSQFRQLNFRFRILVRVCAGTAYTWIVGLCVFHS